VDLDATWLYSNETYRAGVSYAVAYQVYSIVDQVLTPFPHSFHSIPFSEPGYDPGINIPPSPHHYHTIAQSTGHCLKARSPWLRPTLSHGRKREGLISLSSLSETQERSIADKSAHVSIDQPYTLQRFYITTRSAFLADRRQLG
jgi:hypothetical protein